MTVATLASISLLALVVTAAPLASPNDASQLERLSMGVQNAAQAMLQASTGETPKCLNCDQDAELPVTESPDILNNLGAPAATEVEDTVSVDISDLQTDNEKLSNAQDELDILADHSSKFLDPASLSRLESLPVSEASSSMDVAQPKSSVLSPRQINFSLTCMTLGVTVGCVFGLLFLRYILGSRKTALSDIEGQSGLKTSAAGAEDTSSSYSDEKKQLVVITSPEPAPCVDEEKRAMQAEYAPSEAGDSSSDELDEKFVDAEDTPVPLVDLSIPEGPQIVVQRPADRDPELLPLPTGTALPCTPFSTPPPTPPRSPLRRPIQMREANLSSPLARPAWSQRATDAPALGLASFARAASPANAMRSLASSPVTRPGTPTMYIPGAFAPDDEDGDGDEKRALELERARNRAYRAPMPELDVAFALQLRPGLGLGSDPAWLVRFLMAMFGWMTVFIGNGANNPDFGRAIA